jgi:hypothetical protein
MQNTPWPIPLTTEDRDRINRLRRCILGRLYQLFQEVPYASMEVEDFISGCGTTAEGLNWNLVYLEKAGFIQLGKSYPPPPFVASAVAITAAGIDLVEDGAELERRLPVSGDRAEADPAATE